MLDNMRRVRIYTKALEKLDTGKYDDREVWVHDYNEEIYRTAKTHTLNGLHWGYPDGIVYAVTREDPNGAGAEEFGYAALVTKANRKSDRYAGNSRFSIVKYREIKEIVEKGIRQKLAEAEKEAEKDAKFLKKWKAIVAKKFSKYKNAALRIQKEADGTLGVIVINPERWTTRGFGTFLEQIKPGDVSISKEALDMLRTVPERRGLQQMTFFKDGGIKPGGSDPIICGVIGTMTKVPTEEICMMKGSYEALVKVATIE